MAWHVAARHLVAAMHVWRSTSTPTCHFAFSNTKFQYFWRPHNLLNAYKSIGGARQVYELKARYFRLIREMRFASHDHSMRNFSSYRLRWSQTKLNQLRVLECRKTTQRHITGHGIRKEPSEKRRGQKSAAQATRTDWLTRLRRRTRIMVSVSSVLMAPVRGVVWLIKLPFVLVWMLLRYMGSCIYRAVAAILRWARVLNYASIVIQRFIFRFMWFNIPFFQFACLLSWPGTGQTQVDVGMG